VRVIFRIGRRGEVSDVRVEIPSPYPALDSAALRAVYHSAPFPPLPPQWTGDTVLLAATFELKPVGL
jgi:TonB family protein